MTPNDVDADLMKKVLRREGLDRRKALPAPWREEASARIARLLLASAEVAAAQTIALYASTRSEVHTHDLIRELIARRKTVCLPITLHRERWLEFRRVDTFPDGCRTHDLGILEPDPMHWPEIVRAEEMDLILVPGVAFDRRGFRIGYGSGYYDHFLSATSDKRRIGLAFGSQVIPEIPTASWDIPMNALATEDGIVPCGRF